MAEKFQDKINIVYPSLSKGHKKIADFIKSNYEKGSFSIGNGVLLYRHASSKGVYVKTETVKNQHRFVFKDRGLYA
jgi:hypothetical protein